MRHLLTAAELDRATIERLFVSARTLGSAPFAPGRGGPVLALAFFEESLRTRTGFDVAAARLGIATTTVLEQRHAATMSARESLEDTFRTLGSYCDAICLRHPDASAPTRAAAVAGVPVINCGNGTDEHPTQALIDLFTISELCGEIDGVRIAVVGDLRHMRSAHSLLLALGRFERVDVLCISPDGLEMPTAFITAFTDTCGTSGVRQAHEMVLENVDIVYMAGLPARYGAVETDAETRARYAMTAECAAGLNATARILCPMPRVDEIAREVDDTGRAAYFAQTKFGVPVRAALLAEILGGGA
jgi:aspartate carbamoyltransferase catalytic subunit